MKEDNRTNKLLNELGDLEKMTNDADLYAENSEKNK